MYWKRAFLVEKMSAFIYSFVGFYVKVIVWLSGFTGGGRPWVPLRALFQARAGTWVIPRAFPKSLMGFQSTTIIYFELFVQCVTFFIKMKTLIYLNIVWFVSLLWNQRSDSASLLHITRLNIFKYWFKVVYLSHDNKNSSYTESRKPWKKQTCYL